MLSCVVSCVPRTKPTPLLLASITSERWFCGTHMRSRSYVKTPCFQGLYASKQLQKNRTVIYDFETNNRRSGPKGRGFESRHFDTTANAVKSRACAMCAGPCFLSILPGGTGTVYHRIMSKILQNRALQASMSGEVCLRANRMPSGMRCCIGTSLAGWRELTG